MKSTHLTLIILDISMKDKKKKKKSKKCESQLTCKATAALVDKVMKELGAEDRPLKEILEDGNKNN